MTSKTSYNNSISYKKLIMENLRQRGWLFAVSTILLFLLQTVYTTLNIDNYLTLSVTEFITNYQSLFPELLNGANNGFLVIAIIFIAITSGVTGFSYLHSPKSVDFYHSFPVRREQWFRISYISGLLLFLVPYFLTSACTLLVGAAKGILISANLLPSILAVIGGMLCFLIIYHTTILAMMLTGKLVVGTLATLVLIVYGAMLQELSFGLISTFLHTAYIRSEPPLTSFSKMISMKTLGSFFSPMGLYSQLLYGNNIVMEGERLSYDPTETLILFGICFLFLVITWFLTRLLYQKRPLEVAGTALAFPKMASLLKVMIVIPTALFVGLYSDSFYYDNNNTWIITISILAAILLCGIIEFIYTQDLSQIFKRKTASLISIGGVVIILSLLHFDAVGFDSWLPKKEHIESMALYSDTYPEYFSYPFSETTVTQNAHDVALSDTLYSEASQVKDFEPIYTLAKEGVENLKNGITIGNLHLDGNQDYTSIVIRFNQNSGKAKYRSYAVKREHVLDCLEELGKQENYRKEFFPFFHVTSKEIKYMEYNNFVHTKELNLTNDQIQTLHTAYKEDLLASPIRVFQEEEPLGSLTFYWTEPPLPMDSVSGGMASLSNLYLYPSFSHTLKTLKEFGITLDQEIRLEQIAQMVHITYMETPEDQFQEATTSQDYKSELRIPVTDPKEMQQLLDRICYTTNGIVGSKVLAEDSLEIWWKDDASTSYFSLLPEK